MKYSLIITAANEPNTIAKALHAMVDPNFSGLTSDDFELITVIPDEETLKASKNFIQKNFPKLHWSNIQDLHKGKPTALNMAFDKARGKILLLTDGDVCLRKNAVNFLFKSLESDAKIGGVTGRPISADAKDNFWGYIGHLLSDAAHHKRNTSMRREVGGHSLKIVQSGPGFYALSGYVCAIRNLHIKIPENTLVDDAYLTYALVDKGYKIAYAPDAQVFVKYPNNLKDWYAQKVRSVGGYMQLHQFGIVASGKKVRNFWKELGYAWYPISYARSFKQLIWSLFLYPLRLLMWLRIFWEQKVLKKDFQATWIRIESTK